MVKHTFLFEEATWVATGVYFDVENNPIPAAGETTVTHAQNLWIHKGAIRVFGIKPLEIINTYEIIPFEKDKTATTWKAYNPAVGNVTGMCIIIDDTIISTFTSENADLTGVECLHWIDDSRYHNRGFTLKGAERFSSWSFDLRRRS
jgi:hypothetical protein